MANNNYWAEIRNDYMDESPMDAGDARAIISIDAWKKGEDQGEVIARVILTEHGDVVTDYIDPVARTDASAQEAIKDAEEQLREYFHEAAKSNSELDGKNTGISVQPLDAETGKYPESIMRDVREHLGLDDDDTSRDGKIMSMSRGMILDAVMEWDGLIGYGGRVLDWIEDIYGVNLSDLPERERPVLNKMSMDTYGLAVAGHVGTWHTIDHTEVDGHNFWLMEHDTYGDDSACIIVDDRGKLSLSNVYDGFDEHTIDLLRQEVMPVEKMPDDSITIDDMKNYGYGWGGMLPMREEAAAEVMKSCTIYRLYGDNSEGMVENANEIAQHAAEGGIFGVEKIDWKAALERQAFIQDKEPQKPSLDHILKDAQDRQSGKAIKNTENISHEER